MPTATTNILYVDFMVNKSLSKDEFAECPTACKYVEDLAGLKEIEDDLFRFIDENPFYAVDIETARIDGRPITKRSPIGWRTDIMCCVSISNGIETFVIKNSHIELHDFYPYVKKITSKPWANQTIKFDSRFFLRDYGLMAPLMYDTEIAARCIASVPEKRYNLLSIVEEHLGEVISKEEQISNWGGRIITISQIGYSARDAYYVMKLVPVLNAKMNSREHLNTLNKESPYSTVFGVHHKIFHLEMAIVPIFCQMEDNGIYVDFDHVDAKMAEAMKLEDKLIMEMITLAGEKFNPRSSAQILEIIRKLYPKQGRINENGKFVFVKNLPSATHDDFRPFTNQGMPFIDTLYTFRMLTGNFQRLEEFYTMTDKSTSRLYTSFRTWGAVTGRTSNPKPNLQNIKNDAKIKAGGIDLNLRGFFTAPPGTKLIDVDYSLFQLVIVAVLSRDPVMMDVLTRKIDIHKMTAAIINGISFEDVTKEQRQKGKSANFGIVFGMGGQSLVEYAWNNFEVFLLLEEAQEMRYKFFETYKYVKKWHESVLNSRRGGVFPCRDLYGREMVAFDFTQATNQPVQATEASIIKYAMVLIDKELKELGIEKHVRLVNMIHDELLYEADEEYADAALPIIETNMEKAGNMILRGIVPVRAEGAVITDWTQK